RFLASFLGPLLRHGLVIGVLSRLLPFETFNFGRRHQQATGAKSQPGTSQKIQETEAAAGATHGKKILPLPDFAHGFSSKSAHRMCLFVRLPRFVGATTRADTRPNQAKSEDLNNVLTPPRRRAPVGPRVHLHRLHSQHPKTFLKIMSSLHLGPNHCPPRFHEIH
ncbi:hypothetical protein BaRGS_00015213, partial [Batillaria attramentaria]